jgi:hypothetical protein
MKIEAKVYELNRKEKKIMDNKTMFEKLFAINVNDYTEKKNGLTYLSWSYAWAEFKKVYPTATYEIEKFGESKLPYVYDENTGYMVFTKVIADGLTHEMWLPVMDGANKAMKAAPYTYQVKEYNYGKPTGKMIDKTVEAATMFDINKTIMRCLVKNLAMFGLGLYIYAGEDLPEEPKVDEGKISVVTDLISKYAEIKQGNAEQLTKHYLNKYKAKTMADLTVSQAETINKELTALVQRRGA